MEGRVKKDIVYQAVLRKFSRHCHRTPFLTFHCPELRHSLPARAAGKCDLYCGAIFSAKNLGFYCNGSRRECASGHSQPSLPQRPCIGSLTCKGKVTGSVFVFAFFLLSFQEWTIRLSWQSSHCWMAKARSLIQQARVSVHLLLSSHWVSICPGSPVGRVSNSQ